MKSVVLDTSFILTCIREKIDFFEDIEMLGLQILIPEQVIKEVKQISNSKKKLKFREEAKLAIKLLDKSIFKELILEGKNTDNSIAEYANQHKTLVATLDKELKKKVKSQKIVIRAKKKLEII